MRAVIVCCLLAFGVAVAAEDQASTQFATLVVARTGNVFKEGWLPAWLPPSTHDIQIRKRPEGPYSQGQFFVQPKELSEFNERVRYCGKWFEPPDGIKTEMGDLRTIQERVYQDYDDHVVWLFACRRDGFCRFWQWQRPPDA